MIFSSVLAAYGLQEADSKIEPFGTGLINHTWKVSANDKAYILQQINDQVFLKPGLISANLEALGQYLHQHYPGYRFVRPLPTTDNRTLVHIPEKGYFRLTPFVAGSHTYDVVQNSNLAREAARQFGKFTRLLAGFPAGELHITLPDFHNLTLRYYQFSQALLHGNQERVSAAAEQITAIHGFGHIVDQYEKIRTNAGFRIRVTHHDTKISNVLFDAQDQGLCVIDLDTVMPGYFISDLGDMMRTYLSPVSEEEQDFSLIRIREDYFRAIVEGYLSEMQDELTAAELTHIVYSGKFMIYMQALRFLTDHLNNDIYYGARYPGHNLMRAINQLTLLQRLTEKENMLNNIQYAS